MFTRMLTRRTYFKSLTFKPILSIRIDICLNELNIRYKKVFKFILVISKKLRVFSDNIVSVYKPED